MKLPDQLHCLHCKGRLSPIVDEALRCTDCQRIVRIVDGIVDFAGAALVPAAHSDRHHGDLRLTDATAAALLDRLQTTAGDRWPGSFGDTIQFGCGRGEVTLAIASGQSPRSLLVFDSEIEMLQACRTRLAGRGFGGDWPVAFATPGPEQDPIRDAVADTVMATTPLSEIADVRRFLAMVYRVLRPNGRAMFVVPNRRYHEAMSQAIAEALVQRRARDGAWPEGQPAVLEMLARGRRLLIHNGDLGCLTDQAEKHLFDSEVLETLCGEVGFASALMLPLEPDAVGVETMRRTCQQAGAPDDFVDPISGLAATVGKPFFSLLTRQDSSANMLLWLTKASGPDVRIFTPPAPPPPVSFVGPEAAVGGAMPRWSVELLARDTPDGILLSVGGWCLCNADVHWVRVTLAGVGGQTPVWRPRPDVHDVLNRTGLYHPLNTLCSGLAGDILFAGVYATDNTCTLRLEVILASGLIVTGAAPDVLVMNEPMVIAH